MQIQTKIPYFQIAKMMAKLLSKKAVLVGHVRIGPIVLMNFVSRLTMEKSAPRRAATIAQLILNARPFRITRGSQSLGAYQDS